MSLEPDLPDSLPAPDVAETLGTDAAVAQASDPHANGKAAEPHDHHGPFHTHCENCGAELAGPWCHACGQHDFEFHRSFRHVLMEALEAFLHFDGNFLRSTSALLFRPGWLTEQFNAGKRAAQMPPFRLYLFVAFVFFFVMHFVGDDAGHAGPVNLTFNGVGVEARTDVERMVWAELTRAFHGEDWYDGAKVGALVERMRELAGVVEARLATARSEGRELTRDEIRQVVLTAIAEDTDARGQDGAAGPTGDATVEAAAMEEAATVAEAQEPLPPWVARLADRTSDEGKRRQLVEKFFASIPKILLVCMPLFALLTRLLFRKSRDFVYLKHLVLALHFHTFLYLWTLVVMAVAWVAGLPGWGLDGWVELCGFLWVVAYVPWMLRRLFGNSWPKTLVKTMLLAGAYSFTLVAAFTTAAALIFVF